MIMISSIIGIIVIIIIIIIISSSSSSRSSSSSSSSSTGPRWREPSPPLAALSPLGGTTMYVCTYVYIVYSVYIYIYE